MMDFPYPELLTSCHRNETWRVDLLDLAGNYLGPLDGVTGGSLDFSIHNTIRSGGSLDYVGEPQDWNRRRIRVYYVVKCPLNNEWGWPLGTFIPGTTSTSHLDTGSQISLSLYDRLLSLDRDQVSEPYTVPKGTPVMQAVSDAALASLGFPPRLLMDETDEEVRTTRMWEPGTSRLRIVNDLLDSINYFSLVADGMGDFVARKRVSAADRGVVWEFRDDELSIYSPDFSHEYDGFDVPNKVSASVEGDDENPGFTAVATDEDPDSPWSYQYRGEWINRTLDDAEATSQQVLQDMVNRALADAQQVGSTYQITHDMVPIWLNDAVKFRRDLLDISVKAVVQSFSVKIDFEGGSEMESTIREVRT